MLPDWWTRFDTAVVLVIVALLVPAIAVSVRTAPGHPAPKPSPRAGRRPNHRAADPAARRRSQTRL